ncbi:MAG TPA: hypothetical protein VF521_02945, partial [Pyrinomonadaceae bacterium]
RSVLFIKGDYFVIRDETDARARHRYELRFHFAAGVGDASTSGVELHAHAHGGRWRTEDDWVSPCYGSRVAAPVRTFEVEGEGPQDFLTVVLPRAAGVEATRVLNLEQEGVAHFLEVVTNEVRDFLIVGRAGQHVAAGRFTTDFAWTWARLTSDGVLKEVVLVGGGTRFGHDGRELLSSPRRLRFAVARADAGRLEFESEPGGFDEQNGDSVNVDGALKRRDKLSKEGRGRAARETSETPHTRRGL